MNCGTGEAVRGRCRATNLCEYCARLAAVETAEMLALDAVEGSAPQLWIVLTTRTAEVDPARFYASRRKLWLAVRRRWPDAEYVGLVEFTTGYGPRSGGSRRPHWNLLVKGVPAEAEAELLELVRRVWCSREDAEPWAQYVGPVAEVGGLMRYLALHFLKESQAPPRGWRGHRVVASRGYFAGGRAEARARARRALRLKRLLWQGLELDDAEAELARRELERWELRAVAPQSWLSARGAATATTEPREVARRGVVPAAKAAMPEVLLRRWCPDSGCYARQALCVCARASPGSSPPPAGRTLGGAGGGVPSGRGVRMLAVDVLVDPGSNGASRAASAPGARGSAYAGASSTQRSATTGTTCEPVEAGIDTLRTLWKADASVVGRRMSGTSTRLRLRDT